MKRLFALAFAFLFLAAGCRAAPADRLTQVATIDALLAGAYDGYLPLAELARHGDLGLGTFHALDGEMILLDGRFYQVRADGRVYRPDLAGKTPFACVTDFAPDLSASLAGPLDQDSLAERIEELLPEANGFCAFTVAGRFRRVRTRSVPAQSKPYPPLAAVTEHQAVFDLEDVQGTLVGFRAPDFVRGLNVPGYHLHFLTADRTAGGHVLAFALESGWLELDVTHRWLTVYLPPGDPFGNLDLSPDRGRELQRVER